MKCVEESHNKRVYQEPPKYLSFGLLLAFIPLYASTLLWLHQGDRHFTCFRVAQSAVNCEVFFQPLLPLPSTTELYKDVRGAGTKTEIETDEDGDRTTYYYVTLKTPAEKGKPGRLPVRVRLRTGKAHSVFCERHRESALGR
jgi:hypothetical protein